ncbi:MAG: helix-turn-helix domain-containing protein [Proteiniphilum sp.]|nr:helix-turn-helix domain-containing protein [Proteiniphilum sp.]
MEGSKRYTVNEVAATCNCAPRTARKWAQGHNVFYIGEGNRKEYRFTDADIERFRERPLPGRRWYKDTEN